jgi:antitoxin component YwqK of YwqJK toxin-antitoxin module
MNKVLSVLLVSVILIGCSEDRVLYNDLTEKGTKESPIMYYKGSLFSGVGFGKNGFEQYFEDGKQHGYLKIYYENGQLNIHQIYKDNKLNGLSLLYYKNGQLEQEGNFDNGTRIGLWKWYTKNGQLEYEGNYKDGVRNGVWINYDESGTESEKWEDFYNLGNKIYTRYFKNGKLFLKKCWDKRGRQINCKEWDEKGKQINY